MIIDHICFAVNNLCEGIEYWVNVFGYKQMTDIIKNSRLKVNVAFMSKTDSITIKLIEPFENNLSLKKFVAEGGGFHHLCFKCENTESGLTELLTKGLQTIIPPQQGEAFEHNIIAFLQGNYGLKIELIDTDKKSSLLNNQ